MGNDCWSKPKQVAELSEEQKTQGIEALEIDNDEWMMALGV
jgi:hypothetical protein